MIVVDEAHHVFKSDTASTGVAFKEHVKALITKSPEAHLVLLSDISQSEGRDSDYPEGLHVM
eukprot:CAMPEP_0173411934 /NCGR_PEP_ID=MMETSP1356-20130122/78348_1 /TAXON_ID=77927 ORGANISM="Hemiselmis virescens, Strain PCC157" /NCGR_SAMPLE_ID=MMETSP1356 /ASSEMBLY_ACC=CAM_ASM_000847 /LENGTH=61 /DNA_ID=CAMNT_0014373763 /DNA_START=27 /DNA_END=209 /DNA_ORIENTATION=+